MITKTINKTNKITLRLQFIFFKTNLKADIRV